jgi:hypothetical protein
MYKRKKKEEEEKEEKEKEEKEEKKKEKKEKRRAGHVTGKFHYIRPFYISTSSRKWAQSNIMWLCN